MSHLKSKALQKLSSDQTNPFISSQTKHADKHNEFSTLFLLQRQKLSQQSKKKRVCLMQTSLCDSPTSHCPVPRLNFNLHHQ